MPNHPQREAIVSRVNLAVRALSATLAPEEAERFAVFASASIALARTVSFAELEPTEAAAMLLDTWQFFSAVQHDGPNVRVTAVDGGVRIISAMVDQPFIVDTIRFALRDQGAQHLSGFNVVIRMNRDASGVSVAAEGEGRTESLVAFEASGIDGSTAAALEANLTERLTIARVMVADFDPMCRRVENAAEAAFDVSGEDGIETAELLRWLLSDNFVFMGVSGPSADGADALLGADRLPPSALWPAPAALVTTDLVHIHKGQVDAPVHRHGRVDEIRVQLPSGPVVIRGVFTHRALTQPCRHLPILRRVLATVLSETRQRPNSYRYRGLANIFDSLPTEWLFSASPDQIRDVLDRVFDAEQDQVARVHVTQRDQGQTTFTLFAIPERRYSESVRTRTLAFLGQLTGASYSDSGLFAGRFETALLQVYQTGTRSLSQADTDRLQNFIAELTTPWTERVAGALTVRFGDAAPSLLARYANAFPPEYAERASADQSVEDISRLEDVRRTGRVATRVSVEGDDVLLRVYEMHDILLTDLMPVIDNFGLVISDQLATPVLPRGLPPQHVDTFRIASVPGIDREELLGRADRLVAGLEAVFQKHLGSDPFNRLVLRAGLTWEEVDLVRAYFGYARQIGLRHTMVRVQEILLNQAPVVAAIINLFHAKFDPDLRGDRAMVVAAAEEHLKDLLLKIKTNDEDFVMRRLVNLVDATLRTNFYRTDRIAHYISVKMDHTKTKDLPLPRMMVEIYVHHREVEGVHLRGGPIARGGIRFSDRADFRTEILGLVTTQMVKNVVIVPEGSKGGFYIKYTIADAAERRRKGDELYQFLMRGMLDVTDNIVDGAVVRPPRVVALDGDDPYLVVAADKGTAHLSDTANRISKEYGFWLGDAFASGGSNGYDHKVVGITARGGWVLVKRHFRELGLDADKDLFTCAGVGDCGGDVFGNGVIETNKMRLLAAFNHVHIFLDPNPDPEASFEERVRLFNEVKGWDHYDKSKISLGGGVFDRRAKTVPLSAEARAILGTLAEELTPDQVVTLILKMPVDLFWNGGIGTYVRASWETNADANDPPNDELRITAQELKAKMIGEGGNLGLTQAARIEYALAGGRLNTDFVDNSGGVDCSDHEVNLKILLNPMVAAGRFDETERNDFLRTLTGEVAAAVLADCNANGRLISLDVLRSSTDPFPYGRAIDWVAKRGNVSRQFLVLPSDDDLKRRASVGTGLTRPELAVLQAHVKMHVFKLLMQDDTALIPRFDEILRDYFPTAVRERFALDLPKHMLAKAIGMTMVLTQVATDAGAAFFPLMLDLTGASAGRVAGAWIAAMDLTGGDSLKATLLAEKANPEGAYLAWNLYTQGVAELVASWLAPGSAGAAGEHVERFGEALAAIAETRDAADSASFAASVSRLVSKGIAHDTAERIMNASNAALASEVCAVATARGEPILEAAGRYQAVGHASRLLPSLRSISARRGVGPWDPVALGILRLRYLALLREVAIRTPIGDELKLGTDRAAEALATGPIREVARITEQIVGDAPDVASLLVGEQQIRAVLH
ncbi:MAG: NAD-glutamate dehydrogenase [Pseudomonadota bacterium]|nr:NAD-glutamate dehydrogenase [Pseudomonadota bacterium]